MIRADMEIDYVKSCLNYTGGKHRLLKQITPLFPGKIRNFTDLFCGGANVSVNVHADGWMQAIDQQKEVIRLFNTLKRSDHSEVMATIHQIITKFELSETSEYGYETYGCESSAGLAAYNKASFLKLRTDYNNRTEDNSYYDLMFYVLTVYGFNNQIRFNKKGHYNIPVGKRDFNDQMKSNLDKFMQRIKDKNIEFIQADFREVDIEMAKGDFLYADPPYLISTATYNEQNGWTEQEEKDLLQLLDRLDEGGVKFALSNVLEHKNRENSLLIEWARHYNVHQLNYHYHNANYQVKTKTSKTSKTSEVLITNY